MLSLSQHYIPEEWRIHAIIPIFKSGDHSSVLCYRPISLLCSISKVLERIIYNAIVKFTTQYISLTQFGFLKNHSSQQQLLLFLSNFMRPSSSPIDVVYLDFKKAFDSVPHNELLVKLWSFGITGNLWNWFKGYLLNRTQCVRINNAISSSLPVISGVPQGSILGPLLFLIFINDLPVSVTNSHLFLFADDAKCLKQIDNVEDHHKLQQDLQNLTSWSEKWNLHFNEKKSVLLRYNSRGTYPARLQTYYINNRCITSKQNHKDLGVLMRTDLSWSDHYDYILSKAYKTMGLLRRTLVQKSIYARRILYLSLVRSVLTYCSPMWRPQYLKDIRVLENVQRRATKFILKDYKSCYKSRLLTLHLLPLMMELEIADVIFFISSIKLPNDHFNILQHVTFTSTTTRSSSSGKLVHNICHSNRDKHFYFNRLPRLWNSLPIIDLSQGTKSLKRKLKEYFWNHFLTSFDPENPCTFHLICPCSKCAVLPVSNNYSMAL